MEEELKKKVIARGHNKTLITKLYNYITQANLSDISPQILYYKRERLVSVFTEYESYCTDILYLNPNDDEDFDAVEENYLTILMKIDDRLKCSKYKTKQSSIEQCTPSPVNINLPKITIKPFNDSYTAKAYQMERDSDTQPCLEEFLKYLEKRALALENADQGYHQQQPSGSSGYSKVAAHIHTAPTCSYYITADSTADSVGLKPAISASNSNIKH